MKGVSKDMIRGILALGAAVAMFSSIEVASKVIGARANPFQLVFIRFFSTGAILLLLGLPAIRARMSPLGPRDYAVFALTGFLGIAVSLSLFHIAITVSEKAASCAVIFSANPIFTALFAPFINKEPWNARKAAAVCAGAAGVGMFAWDSGAFSVRSLSAMGIMSLSAAAFALNICISKRVIARYGVYVLMGFSALFGSVAVLPLAVADACARGLGGIQEAWALILYVALAGTALAYSLYYYGLLNCSAFSASMMFFLKPVLASLLAAAILGEKFNRFMLVGAALVVCGLFFMLPGPTRKRQAAAALNR